MLMLILLLSLVIFLVQFLSTIIKLKVIKELFFFYKCTKAFFSLFFPSLLDKNRFYGLVHFTLAAFLQKRCRKRRALEDDILYLVPSCARERVVQSS